MSEREITFSQDEREQIGQQAIQTANLGENFVYELVSAKFEVMKLCFSWPNSPKIRILFPKMEQILHESDVLSEIIRQARVIMQIRGIDSLSLLDKETWAAGMGSVFDPDSEIGKKLSDYLYK